MKKAHISSSLDRTWLLPLISITLLSVIIILTVNGSHRESSSTVNFSLDDQPNVGDHQFGQPRLPRLAYLISGTKGDGQRLKRVLQAVYHPRNYYLLHLDLEAPDGERLELAKYVKLEGVMRDFKNVMVIGKANLVTYKGPTMIASTLHAVAILLKQAKDWDWFINLSASDYPLMPQDGNYSLLMLEIIHSFID